MSHYQDPARISRVAVVGIGALGASWVLHLLGRGLAVSVSDPDPGVRERLERYLGEHGTGTERVRHLLDPAQAAAESELVIESGPEVLAVKRELIAELDAGADPRVLIASSSSGLLPSSFGDAASHPDRVLVAHPFNPPHLIPVVEVVGGRETAAAAIDTAMKTFAWLGKSPVRINAELPGHVVNRLQAALWQEAYALVHEGVISAADLDRAVADGPGLRWALLGPLATQHLSGGGHGIAGVLRHLGPPAAGWMRDLRTAPELTEDFIQAMADGVAAEFGTVDDQELLRARDRLLGELIRAKEDVGLPPLSRPSTDHS